MPRLVRACVLASSRGSERALGKTLGDIDGAHGATGRAAGHEPGRIFRIAWSYVYAEGSGATSEGSDQVSVQVSL